LPSHTNSQKWQYAYRYTYVLSDNMLRVAIEL